jgi:hypothetical protein
VDNGNADSREWTRMSLSRSHIEAALNSDSMDLVRLDDELLSIARQDPAVLVEVAGPLLASSSMRVSLHAALALGRAAEFGDDALISHIESVLLVYLGEVDDLELIQGIATAMLHIWGRKDANGGLDYFRHEDYRYRLIAAKSLALSAGSPMEPEVQAALLELETDADPHVRRWATIGLDVQ